MGGGQVIEAQGVRTGVITTNVSKWHTWGELKGVDYANTDPSTIEIVPPKSTTSTVINTNKPAANKQPERSDVPMETGNAMVTADGGVNLRSEKSTKSTRLAVIPKGAKINAEVVDDTWSSAEYKGKKGYVATRYITYDGEENGNVIVNEQMQIIANIQKELSRLKTLLGV